MNYQETLKKHGITNKDIETLSNAFRDRAHSDEQIRHPEAIYHTAAVDLVCGAIELHLETQAGMQKDHSLKQWITILTGINLNQT